MLLSSGTTFLTEMLALMRVNSNICVDPIYFSLCDDEQRKSVQSTGVLQNNTLQSNQVEPCSAADVD